MKRITGNGDEFMRDPSFLKRREVKQHREAAKVHTSKNREWVLLAETLDEFR